jgi:Nif-specific regulatory protein
MDVNLTLEDAINEFKKEFIKLNLKNTNGVKSKAAVNMGIQRTYLSRLISRYDIT